MTPEFDLLLAAFGVLLAVAARARNDQMLFSGEWHRPPRWIIPIVRGRPGPVALMAVAFEVWGVGIGILGSLAAFEQTRSTTGAPLLALWLLGGIVALTVFEFAMTTISKVSRRRR